MDFIEAARTLVFERLLIDEDKNDPDQMLMIVDIAKALRSAYAAGAQSVRDEAQREEAPF